MKRAVSIIGCGVSGLTTAIVLQREGWDVTIYTDQATEDTTSAIAAAIWFPYKAEPRDRASSWSKASYLEFEKLSLDPDTGVSMVPYTAVIRNEEDAWWRNALPSEAIRKARADEMPPSYKLGYRMRVPLIETPLYLPYLLREFTKAGGLIVKQKIEDPKGLITSNLKVINCAGLGARELVDDLTVYPINGQIIKAHPIKGIEATSAEFPFDAAREQLAFIIPRRDCTVLGGTALKDHTDLKPVEAANKGILERCTTLSPLVKQARIQNTVVGLRPGRDEIRLEREGNLIHNYGHGGVGYTVSWGCAFAVRDLLKNN